MKHIKCHTIVALCQIKFIFKKYMLLSIVTASLTENTTEMFSRHIIRFVKKKIFKFNFTRVKKRNIEQKSCLFHMIFTQPLSV